jgi:predicted DNA-binding antitoxin AbrB/MazE fold protein
MDNDKVVQAVYENGVLRPLTPLTGVAEGQTVSVIVREAVTDPEEIKRREAAFLRHMEENGLLERFPPPKGPPPKDWQPLVLEGEPLSETIIRMRGEG